MARRNRYRMFEQLMTKIILADAALFLLFLIFSGMGLTVLKVIAAILTGALSVLCIVWLHITGELTKRRSLWIVTSFASIILCMLVSLALKYPCPPIP